MRILIDTCVLYPTVMREMVLGAASAGVFTPLWSSRILEEWVRAAAKIGPTGPEQARAEIALLRSAWPDSEVAPKSATQSRIWLPDVNDIHVLAAAIDASADAIMTVNAKDFPRGTLAEEGVSRIDPDSYLVSVWQNQPDVVERYAVRVLDQARRLSGEAWQMRPLLKKARLPRLAKALG